MFNTTLGSNLYAMNVDACAQARQNAPAVVLKQAGYLTIGLTPVNPPSTDQT